MQLGYLQVQLGDHLLELLLKSINLLLNCRLNILDDVCKLLNVHLSLCVVSFVVLLELLHSQIVKNRVKLTVKVDFVTHCAEFLRDSLVVLLLLDEIGYIIDWQL